MEITEVAEDVYEIPRSGDMRVPARVYASEPLLEKMREEGQTLEQVRNVATLPASKYSVVLPDGHLGYGFIQGVAAVDMDGGAISPGGIGFDINCGVRVLRTPLDWGRARQREDLVERLYDLVPCGLGKGRYVGPTATTWMASSNAAWSGCWRRATRPRPTSSTARRGAASRAIPTRSPRTRRNAA
ncbi:RtcB family protein [Halomarina halobia]|uniref:RtcB family protein n=1 Tax=Halomarina halobia TaxID=3033386 RepID=UPI003616D1E0